MATVQKKPRKLPKINQDTKDDEDEAGNKPSRGASKDKKAPNPAPGRKRELPPLRKTGQRRDMDSKSMVEMGRTSPIEADKRTSQTATIDAKLCYFYVDNDYTFNPIRLVIQPRHYKKLDTVARDLSMKMRNKLTQGVRSIHTARGHHRIYNLEDLTNEGHYVCSSNRKYAKGMDVQRVNARRVWHNNRPDSGRRNFIGLLKDTDLSSAKYRGGKFRPGYDLSRVYTRVPPKTTTVMKNGDPDTKHSVLLNRRTAQTFEQVLKDLSETFRFAIRKLYTIDGEPVSIKYIYFFYSLFFKSHLYLHVTFL